MGKFANYMEEDAPPPTPVAPEPTASERRTSVATAPPAPKTPAEIRREQQEEFVTELRKDLSRGRTEAALYGLQRGAAPGADVLAGIGGDAGEAVASLVHGLNPPAPNTAQKVRAEYAANEAQAQRDYPGTFLASEVAGSIPATIGIAGSAPLKTLPVLPRTAGILPKAQAIANTPAGRLATQNFATGYMNTPSDDPRMRAVGGLTSVVAGEAAGAVGEKVGKFLGNATAREHNGLVRDILKNSETEVAATPTARKRFMNRAGAAVDEVKAEPELGRAIRAGDMDRAGRIAESRLEILSEPRTSNYAKLDAHEVLGIDQIDAYLRKAATRTVGAKKRAIEAWRNELNEDWIPRWKTEGRLIVREGKPLGVAGLGVREWVSDAQKGASTVIGGLEEGPRKEVKAALEDIAEDVWHGHLNRVAQKDAALVKEIRTYDRRASGLLAAKQVFEQRALKDQEGIIGIAKRAENKADTAVAGMAAAGAALGHPGTAALGYGAYQAAKMVPRAARELNDRVLAPVQRAAAAGKGWAEVSNLAAETGLPQSTARAIFDMTQRALGSRSTETSTRTR